MIIPIPMNAAIIIPIHDPTVVAHHHDGLATAYGTYAFVLQAEPV